MQNASPNAREPFGITSQNLTYNRTLVWQNTSLNGEIGGFNKCSTLADKMKKKKKTLGDFYFLLIGLAFQTSASALRVFSPLPNRSPINRAEFQVENMFLRCNLNMNYRRESNDKKNFKKAKKKPNFKSLCGE